MTTHFRTKFKAYDQKRMMVMMMMDRTQIQQHRIDINAGNLKEQEIKFQHFLRTDDTVGEKNVSWNLLEEKIRRQPHIFL